MQKARNPEVVRYNSIFLTILVPYGMGIATAYHHASDFLLKYHLWTAATVFILLSAIRKWYFLVRVFRLRYSNALLVYLFWYLAGGAGCLLKVERLSKKHFSRMSPVLIRATVTEIPVKKKEYLRFVASVNCVFAEPNGWSDCKLRPMRAKGHVLVSIKLKKGDRHLPGYGSEFIAISKMENIKVARRSPFDYRSYLAARNVHHRLFLKPESMVLLSKNKGNRIMFTAIGFRDDQARYYEKVFKNKDYAGLASALILGLRTDLGEKTLDNYIRTGTVHALSVSGMHVGTIYIVLNTLLWFLRNNGWMKIIRSAVMIVVIWLYALVTGFSPSILRAAIMLSVTIVSRAFNSTTTNGNVVGFTAFILLVYDPLLIWDIGFQLSFSAVCGLVWLQPFLENFWCPENKLLQGLWSAIAMSLAAQIATTPFIIFYFHQFPVYFLIANLFITIPLSLLIYIGIAILIFRITWLCIVFRWLADFTNNGLAWISSLPFAVIEGIWVGKLQILLLGFLLLAGVFWIRSQMRKY